MFRKLERLFLLTLTPREVYDLRPRQTFVPHYAICYLRHHIEFLLALKGLKPCLGFLYHDAPGQKVLNNKVAQCLKPVFEEFKLEEYGFRLHLVDRPSYTNPKIHNTWVFVDTRSDLWPKIDSLIVAPSTTTTKVLDLSALEIFGFPAVGDGLFRVVDLTEVKYVGNGSRFPHADSVRAYSITCGYDIIAYSAMMKQYTQSNDLAKDMGVELAIDFTEHRGLQNLFKEAFPDQSGPLLLRDDVGKFVLLLMRKIQEHLAAKLNG